MNVTRTQIKDGIVKYLEDEVVKTITDKPVMMIADVMTNMVKGNPKALDKLMDSTIVSMMLEQNMDGTYNLDSLFDAMHNTMNVHGNFELKLPFIKTPFVFNQNDVRNLKSYIESGA